VTIEPPSLTAPPVSIRNGRAPLKLANPAGLFRNGEQGLDARIALFCVAR